MSIGYVVALSAVPFIDLLAEQESALVAVLLGTDGEPVDTHVAGNAVEATRRRLIQGVDSAVRSLPASVRGDQSASKAFAYALVALADERMLHHPTGAIERWRARLLETELYDTALAGQEVVRRARAAALSDAELETGVKTMEDSSVFAPLYLALLRAGFEGSLRGDPVGLSALVASLEESTASVRPADRRTFALPPAADRPARSAISPRALAVIAFLVWLLGAPVLWYGATADVFLLSASIAERLREGLPPIAPSGELIHGIGPTSGPESRIERCPDGTPVPEVGPC